MKTENLIHKHLIMLCSVDRNGEPSVDAFSKSPCNCCGDWLAGERHEVKALRKGHRGQLAVMRPAYPLWVCPDCVVAWQ